MQTREALKVGIDMAHLVTMSYLDDMSDADLMKRPHPQCNHINWQVGHLIASEHQMLDAVIAGGMPPLPDGFEAKYDRSTASSDDPSQFCTKDELMAAYRAQREGMLKGLAAVEESDWTKETGVSYAPTQVDLYSMQGNHWLMHCGQWVIVRRQLGKPIVI